jgi:ADP-ribose pyrophosphatase YjhB (NUDIX family)
LLVASRYPNHPEPLWNLPGGRVRLDESFGDAVVRECREETGLAVEPIALRYLSESLDRSTGTRFVNATFEVRVLDAAFHDDGALAMPHVPAGDAHAVEARWVALDALADLLRVNVVREPLLANLADPTRRYFAFADAGITIEFNDPA